MTEKEEGSFRYWTGVGPRTGLFRSTVFYRWYDCGTGQYRKDEKTVGRIDFFSYSTLSITLPMP